MMNFKPLHLKIKSHPENLKQIRKFVSDAISNASFSKEDCGSIILAMDEACSNIIRHSYKNDHTQEIEITITITSEILEITVIDSGSAFDINTIESRDVSEVKPGGLGIYIIQHIMDQIDFKRTPDGYNQLILTKKITP